MILAFFLYSYAESEHEHFRKRDCSLPKSPCMDCPPPSEEPNLLWTPNQMYKNDIRPLKALFQVGIYARHTLSIIQALKLLWALKIDKN